MMKTSSELLYISRAPSPPPHPFMSSVSLLPSVSSPPPSPRTPRASASLLLPPHLLLPLCPSSSSCSSLSPFAPPRERSRKVERNAWSWRWRSEPQPTCCLSSSASRPSLLCCLSFSATLLRSFHPCSRHVFFHSNQPSFRHYHLPPFLPPFLRSLILPSPPDIYCLLNQMLMGQSSGRDAGGTGTEKEAA